MLTGIFLDRLMGAKCLASGSARRLLAYFACLGCASLSLLIGISRLFPGSIGGDLPGLASDVRPASPVAAAAWISFGFALAIATAFKLRLKEEPPDPTGEPARQHEDAMLGGVAIASAVVVGLVGRDLTVGPPAIDVLTWRSAPSYPSVCGPRAIVLPWLSEERSMELAADAVEIYCWDRLGSDN